MIALPPTHLRLGTVGWLPIAILVLALAATEGRGSEISVNPMLVELKQRPNSRKNFSFSIRSDKATEVQLKLFDMSQQLSGYMGFQEKQNQPGKRLPATIRLERTRITLPPEKSVTVRGQLRLSARVRGTQLFAVMVEEVKPKNDKKGIAINVRYAVVIKVNVLGRRSREIGKIETVTIEKNKSGKLILVGIHTNNSSQDYRVRVQH